MIRPTSVHAIARGTVGSGKSLLLYWLEQMLLDIGVTSVKSVELETEKRLRRFDDIQEWEIDTLRQRTIVLTEHTLGLQPVGGRKMHLRPELPDVLESDKHLYLSIAGPVNSGRTLILNRFKMLLAEKGIMNVELRERFPDEAPNRDFNHVPENTLETLNRYTWYLEETQGAPHAMV